MTNAPHSRLRAIRAAVCGGLAAIVAAVPSLEPAFIAAGRSAARRSRLLGTVYWFAQDDLIRRLRQSGNRFRRLPVAGIDTHVDVTDGTGRLHHFHDEPYEPKLAVALADALKSGDSFVDIGANIGFFSVLAARVVGEAGHVFAFEPYAGALSTLRAALAINGVAGIVDVTEAAVGAVDGTTRLFLSTDSVLSTTDPLRSPARDHFRFNESVEVRLVTLDGWLRDRRPSATALAAIKIDVEGTELEVLQGMRETLETHPRAVIFCETETDSAADRLLRERGYVRTRLDVRSGRFGNYRYDRPRG